jgi:hypothetical protein
MSNIFVRGGIAALGAAAALAVAGPMAAHASGYGAPPACGNHSLAVTQTPSDGAAGHGGFVLLFRNRTSQACTIHGYPGLDALGSYGHVLAHADRTLSGYMGGGRLRTVTVAPGQYASATVEWLNFNPVTSGDCTFSNAIAVTPANTSHTVELPTSVSICELQVHPTIAGTTHHGAFAAAQLLWIRGASASSANQGNYWSQAKSQLATQGDEYSYYVNELHQLISLPDANQTPAQNHRYHHDINDLNNFFGTPGLYS